MMATDSPRAMPSDTSDNMASVPSGLLTCLPTRSAASTVFIRSVCIVLACLLLLPGVHAAPTAPARVILVLGDSLSAGYGIRVEQGWVALLQKRLVSKGYGHRVINASSSGETTGGALARLPRALEKHRPAVVIIELGGNDGLRGLPIADVRANFEALIRLSARPAPASCLWACAFRPTTVRHTPRRSTNCTETLRNATGSRWCRSFSMASRSMTP